jgi:glycosyltransferase involved in cell wall biosynthesis
MATHDRAHLVPQAVASFLRQDHPAIELLVVDDGERSLVDVLPDDDRVRHIRLERRHTIGAKRNLGCEAARGDLLANWDDDDWYAPWRLSYQVKELTAAGVEVCGLNQLLYLQPAASRAWRYTWPASARPWVHDAVLLFTRDFWRRNPFPDTSMGIDCRLLWSGPRKRILALPDERFYVGMIHGGNTSPKNTRAGLWRTHPFDDVAALVGKDVEFYREMLSDDQRTAAA